LAAKTPPDWTDDDVSLREHVEAIMDERQEAHGREHELLQSALEREQKLREEALKQARLVVDERLEKLNELRSEVQEDRASYLTKPVFEAFRDERLQKLNELRAEVAEDRNHYLSKDVFENYKENQAKTRRANLIAIVTLAVALLAIAVQVVQNRGKIEGDGAIPLSAELQSRRLERRVEQLKDFIKEKGLTVPSPSPAPGVTPDPILREEPAGRRVPSPPSFASPKTTPGVGVVPPLPEPPPFNPPPTPTPVVSCVPFLPPIPDYCVEVPEIP
jgi:hypothetical protein